jgi:hypothetical protein
MVGTGMTHEVIVIRTSADTFDVIVGHRLNDRPLSRAEANHLAHARRRYQESAGKSVGLQRPHHPRGKPSIGVTVSPSIK